VCVRERERDRVCVCVYVCVYVQLICVRGAVFSHGVLLLECRVSAAFVRFVCICMCACMCVCVYVCVCVCERERERVSAINMCQRCCALSIAPGMPSFCCTCLLCMNAFVCVRVSVCVRERDRMCVFVCNQYAKEVCSYRALLQKRPIILQGSFAKETYGVLSPSLAAKISNLLLYLFAVCVLSVCVSVCV